MFSIFKDMVKRSTKKTKPTQVISKEEAENTLKSFGITDDEISNLKKPKHFERFYLSPAKLELKLESIKEEKNSEKTLKLFGITDDEISNLKKAKKRDVSNAIKNCGIDKSDQDFFFKYLLE
jgi:hypothetical protein